MVVGETTIHSSSGTEVFECAALDPDSREVVLVWQTQSCGGLEALPVMKAVLRRRRGRPSVKMWTPARQVDGPSGEPTICIMYQARVPRPVGAGSHAAAFTDGAAYEASLGPAHPHYIRVKARLLRRIVARHAPSARRLVDLGCGTGEMAEALADVSFDLLGVDLSPQMIAHATAKRIPRATFRTADAASTGLAGASFDLAFATALFHHVDPPARAQVAQEMARLVRPGGLAVVFEHNPANPVTRRMVRTCPVDEGVTLLRRRETAQLLEAAGLAVIDWRYLLFFPRFLAALLPAEGLMKWIPLGGQYVVAARKPGGGP